MIHLGKIAHREEQWMAELKQKDLKNKKKKREKGPWESSTVPENLEVPEKVREIKTEYWKQNQLWCMPRYMGAPQKSFKWQKLKH